ncbi:7261_t:CDS:1, partial [Dentiscutata erythropus]
FFDNPDNQYYKFAQQLGKNGVIDRHSHITIQNIGNINTNTPPNAKNFEFFKGLNDLANNAVLTIAVVQKDSKTPGLTARSYRVYTISSSFGHQPVLMLVAQCGAQDDCVRFTVK